MRWEDLRIYLNELHEKRDMRIDDSVTIYDMTLGEFYPVDILEYCVGDDILDDGAIFLTICT